MKKTVPLYFITLFFPQEREAIQSLAVLEAAVKSCGPVFHTEVGKFKFLNEMIKLVSPKYLVSIIYAKYLGT